MERKSVVPLRQALEMARDGIWRCHSDDEVQRWCRWIMRRLVVTAAWIEEQDLTVRMRHPHWRASVEQAWLFASRPTGSIGSLQRFLKAFGRNVVQEQERLVLGGLPRSSRIVGRRAAIPARRRKTESRS